jgi:phenylacetate-coenzyme A ligase PaaK-like adenylate-forming protein
MLDVESERRLRRAAVEAARHVGLYRDLWRGADFEGSSQRLPLLDKSRLRTATPGERVHDARRDHRLTAELSSGSSGEPLIVHSDAQALLARRFAFLRALLHCGYRPGQCLLILTSRKRHRSWASALARWHYAGIGEDTAALVKRAASLKPQVLYGPLSTLELVAEQVLEHLPRLPSLKFVISTAEQLTAERQRTLERAFGVPVADFYGMTEFGLVAYRPPGGSAYVAARSSLILEYLAVPHDRGVEQLVVSDLAERTSPLLRYDTGDFVRRDTSRLDRPVVEFAGRAFDCILLPNGERISPYRIDVALEDLPDLRGFEVVQQPDLSIDVTIEVAPREAERMRRRVAAQLSPVLGHATPFRIAAGAIRRPPGGSKFRPIRSLAVARA